MASRMQRPLTLKYWNYGQGFDAIKGALLLDVNNKPDPEEMIRFVCKNSRVPFDELLANPSGVRPYLEPHFVLPARKYNSARLELCPVDIVDDLKRLYDETIDDQFSYQLICRRILEAMNSAYIGSEITRKRRLVN